MKNQVLQALGQTLNKKNLKCNLELNFNNFKKRKIERVLG